MLSITDFQEQGGAERLVRFVEQIWGALRPDCGPPDLDGILEEAERIGAERDRIARELEEMKEKANSLFMENERLKTNLQDAVRREGQQAKRALEASAELARLRPVMEATEQFWFNAHGPNEFIYAQKKLGEALTTYRVGAVLDYNCAEAGKKEAHGTE